jgi:hypothetical protein
VGERSRVRARARERERDRGRNFEAMVKLQLTTVGSTRRQVLELPSSQVQVSEVRRMVEKELGLPYERLKLVVGGKTLEDESKGKPVTVSFVDGGNNVLCFV